MCKERGEEMRQNVRMDCMSKSRMSEVERVVVVKEKEERARRKNKKRQS